MPAGMPYHLEKGPTLRLLEQFLNRPRDEMRTGLDMLRASAGSIDWIVNGMPDLWANPTFNHSPAGSGANVRDEIIRDWLGYQPSRGGWVKKPGRTTGYWIGYKGNVNEIIRRALTWAVELSLGLEPGGTDKGRDHPWPIELFWKCPSPWFESWVVTRPIPSLPDCDDTQPVRGLVTVVFITPSHIGSNVAESPIAHDEKAFPPVGHPVPSYQDDYEQLGEAHPDLTKFPGRPVVPAQERSFATWIVSHADHISGGPVDLTTNTTAAADFAEWGIPQMNIYKGTGRVVVVAPSLPSGGVRHDGVV